MVHFIEKILVLIIILVIQPDRFTSSEYVDEIVDQQGLPGRTVNIVTNREAQDGELEVICEDGTLSTAARTSETSTRSALLVHDDTVHGAIGLAGAAHRITRMGHEANSSTD